MDKLYALPVDHYRSLKVQFAAALSGHSLQVLNQAPEFVFGETNRSQSFLEKFPLGKVPALEAQDGTCLFESNAIAYYVANEQLRGKSVQDAAQIQQWINFADNEILPSACTWVYPTLGITQFNKGDTEGAKEHLKKCLNVLNVYLTSRTFLVGERITLADVVLCCNMRMLYQQVLEPSFRNAYGNVNRWFETLVNHPQFLKLANETKLCEKMAQPDHKKYTEIHGKAKGGAQGKPEGGQQQKKDQKPAQQPKKEPKKEPAAEAAAGDAPQEKEDDPLAAAPKGTFDLDGFKRSYSNEDTETKALPFLFDNFDGEHYSIWHAVYKYPEDHSLPFMTGNLAKGMLQRIEKLRKYAFGVVYVLGEEKNHNIEALWIFRGKQVAFTLSENWNVDAPSYEFTYLDLSKPEDKDKVASFIMAQTMGSATFPEESKMLDFMCFK